MHLHKCTHTSMSMIAQWLGNLAVSVCSSIWYYLALIELSSISSFSPPSALLLSSSPQVPARDGGRDRGCQTLFCILRCSVCPGASIHSLSDDELQYSCFQVFSLFFYLLITSVFSLSSPVSTCYFFFLIHLTGSSLPFYSSPCLSLSHPLSLTPLSISIYEWVLMGL